MAVVHALRFAWIVSSFISSAVRYFVRSVCPQQRRAFPYTYPHSKFVNIYAFYVIQCRICCVWEHTFTTTHIIPCRRRSNVENRVVHVPWIRNISELPTIALCYTSAARNSQHNCYPLQSALHTVGASIRFDSKERDREWVRGSGREGDEYMYFRCKSYVVHNTCASYSTMLSNKQWLRHTLVHFVRSELTPNTFCRLAPNYELTKYWQFHASA